MKKLFKVLLVLCFLLVAATAFAGAQDFELVNKSGVDIFALYIAPSNSNDWEEDVLEDDVLLNGESTTVTFSRNESARYWDIRVEDEDGNATEWYKFDLKKISVIVLKKNGEAEYK